MSKINLYSAVGPALGYYYQAIYALIRLFDSQNNNAFVSIETFDDVYHEDGCIKTLTQLKHKTKDSKISIKSVDLWKTIRVWCNYIQYNNPQDGIFVLSTVASIDPQDPLYVLKSEKDDRNRLEKHLIEEAKRILDGRENIRKENLEMKSKGQKERKLPYDTKYQGCEAFLSLKAAQRQALLKNTRLNTEIFSISEAQNEVVKRIRQGTQLNMQAALAESIISWWDREAVRSLTRERKECIYLSELQEFISKKNAELYNDGFTDDIDDREIPPPNFSHPIHVGQLEIVKASTAQKKRSFNTEVKARIQRGIWMKNNMFLISKLKKYDSSLIEEWSYHFDDISEKAYGLSEEEKENHGRALLDWSHYEAHNQVKKISNNYDNPDMVRGSYQILSKDKSVGWHCDYISRLKNEK